MYKYKKVKILCIKHTNLRLLAIINNIAPISNFHKNFEDIFILILYIE